MVGRQPNAPAAFTPGEIPGTRFQRLSRLQGTWFCRKEPRKKSQVTPPGTVRLVAQHLNHYANPGPCYTLTLWKIQLQKFKYFFGNSFSKIYSHNIKDDEVGKIRNTEFQTGTNK